MVYISILTVVQCCERLSSSVTASFRGFQDNFRPSPLVLRGHLGLVKVLSHHSVTTQQVIINRTLNICQVVSKGSVW